MKVSSNKITRERILVFPFDLLSHYLRCIELVKRYPGADIFFLSSARYDHVVQKAGHRVFSAETFNAEKVMACAAKFDFSWLNQSDIERVFLSQVKIIRELAPARVIGDTAPTLKMAAACTGVPCTTLMNGYMSRFYACVRMLPRVHPAYLVLSRLPPELTRFIIRIAEWLSFRTVHKPFRLLRRRHRLPGVAGYLRELEGDENLICDETFLFPQKKLPANYHIIGTLLYDGGQDDPTLLQSIPAGKHVIVVCMGSSGNWESLGFLSSADYSNYTIITAGDLNHKITGNHVLARPFVSLGSVLARCSLLICHGGNGTIYEGLRHHLPILCLTSHFEQEWNVQRLEALGIGLCINSDPKGIIDAHLNKLPLFKTQK